jgi:acetate kinase
MKILVINAGSSSLKYSLFDMHQHSVLIAGLIERIGETSSEHTYALADEKPQPLAITVASHREALQTLFDTLAASGLLVNFAELLCIGHRVVHGGEHFRQPALINPQVLEQIATTAALAPLHNPANLLGIQECLRQMPQIPQVAIFDTAFHHTLPDYAYHYALPATLYKEHGVRRYGFHGTSHGYVARQAAEALGKQLSETNLISLHLGNGASITAIENGGSIDTSMGMTPLEGLMMGTRCGDIDPAIPFYLGRMLGLDSAAIENLLNRDSGCKGICGENDMRTIHKLAEAGDDAARLALDMYAYRIKKYIGSYYAVLGRVDAIIFTGGIGENDSWLRENCCRNLAALGISIDSNLNKNPARPLANIATADSTVAVLVIHTQEELEIAMQAQSCVAQHKDTRT